MRYGAYKGLAGRLSNAERDVLDDWNSEGWHAQTNRFSELFDLDEDRAFVFNEVNGEADH
jgi:hypothetical protein